MLRRLRLWSLFVMVQRLVQRNHPYLLLRGNTYYFRFATPLHITKLFPAFPKEVKRSLRTDSYSQAVASISHKITTIKMIAVCVNIDLLNELYAKLTNFSTLFGDVVSSAAGNKANSSNVMSADSNEGNKILVESPLLSKAWDEYVTWKCWKPKAAQSNQRIYENILFFLGDVSIASVTKQQLKEALVSISGLPVRNKKEYRKKPIAELVNMDVPVKDKISNKYVREHLKLAQGFFSSYLTNEVDMLKSSPTIGLRWEYDDVRFASLSDSQVRRVIIASQSKPEWFQWFILLSVYSGARRSEIAELHVRDFMLDDDSGRYYFLIRQGKTRAAKRRVPVHNELIEAGLMDWVNSIDGLLFDKAKKNPNRATELFNSLLPEDVNDIGERMVLHSLRHTFITKARSTGVSHTLLQQVVGHEKTGAGITDRYTHDFPLSAVLCVVDNVRF